MKDKKPVTEFDEIVRMIEQSRSRAFQKVNEELVILYFTIGKTVSVRVSDGVWGDKTVDELSAYLLNRFPGLRGFTRRGLYRMKQFFETYSPNSECYKLWLEVQGTEKLSQIVSLPATQLRTSQITNKPIVSPMATQLQNTEKENLKFVSTVLTQISWTNHLEIISGSKTPEENLFYLLLTVKEKLSKLELRRQIKTAYFERTMLAKNKINIVPALPIQFPENIFRDPYIFEFLDLPENHSEKDLENALTQNLRKFILEIGKGFTYMGAQFRLQVGNKDYYIN